MRTRINRRRFKLELAKRGLDQARFARLAGLSATTISHASTGKTINPMTFSRIATALARVPPLVNAELVEETDSESGQATRTTSHDRGLTPAVPPQG
jgi:transcriptional regulator with XRE-family HTH domain